MLDGIGLIRGGNVPDLLPKPLENSARPGDTGRSNSIEWRARFLFQKDFLFYSSLSCLLSFLSKKLRTRRDIDLSDASDFGKLGVTRHSRPRFIKHVSIWNARFRYELYISSVTSSTANDKIELPLRHTSIQRPIYSNESVLSGYARQTIFDTTTFR